MPLELRALPSAVNGSLSKLESQNRGGANKGPATAVPSSSSASDVKALKDDNARLQGEVRRLKEELNQLRSPAPSASSRLPARLPPRSSSLQGRRRRTGSDDEGGDDRPLPVRSRHRPLHPPTAAVLPLPLPPPPPPPSRDVEAHQSSQGLHHRRGAAAMETTATASGAIEAATTATAPARRARLLAVTGGGPHDDDSDSDNDDSDPYTGEASFATSSFGARVKGRAGWLVGLLVLQSMSSFIISRNEALLQSHLVIVQFLTMLVGSGGNAGNQAAVQAIRGLATGAVHERNARASLVEELKMGVTLSAILGAAGLVRTAAFAVPLAETMAITTSLCTIVFISIVLGACLPLAMLRAGIDPAHSSTTIQVLMDILGVSITVVVSSAILDSPLHPAADGSARQR